MKIGQHLTKLMCTKVVPDFLGPPCSKLLLFLPLVCIVIVVYDDDVGSARLPGLGQAAPWLAGARTCWHRNVRLQRVEPGLASDV